MTEGKKVAEEHWKWIRKVLFETYRVGYIHNPCGEMDWNEEAIKEQFAVLEPMLKRLCVDEFVHGFKHGYDARRDEE
jgi:hypothetical protein